MMGVYAYVYRHVDSRFGDGSVIQSDCTNGGWSAKYDQVCVINAEGLAVPTASRPAVIIRRHKTMPVIHAVAATHDENGQWTMFGGNFLHSSDSRFSQLCTDLLWHRWSGAVAIHDRIEG